MMWGFLQLIQSNSITISFCQVPLFHNLDDLILDNICDRVKPLVFSKDEKVRAYEVYVISTLLKNCTRLFHLIMFP